MPIQGFTELLDTHPLTPFPLKSLLSLYLKHERYFYLNYFENFRVICNWLSPIETPEAQIYNSIPRGLFNWDTYELSSILKCDTKIVWWTLLEIQHGRLRLD